MKKWFLVSSKEEKGIWALNIIIGAILVFKLVSYWLPKDEFSGNHAEVEAAFLEFVAEQNRLDSIKKAQIIEKEVNTPHKKTEEKATQLFVFNPNTIGLDSLMLLGFKDYQANNLIRYRNAGGKFKKAEDLNKLYGMQPQFAQKLMPFVRIPVANETKVEAPVKEKTPLPMVELNSADTSALKTLKGIGSYFAKKITDRRNELGGFHSKNQLLEVWKIDSAIFTNNPERIDVDATKIRKINVNSATKEQLAKHPYLSWKQANSIVAYRKQHGNYKSIVQIKASVLITDEVYLKIAPYLTIE